MNESCIASTEPLDAAVVAVAQSALVAGPKRSSLPSMFPPARSAEIVWSAPSAWRRGLPPSSAATQATVGISQITVMAASRAQPCLRSPTIWPNVMQEAAGIRRIARHSRKFASGVGFSYGWAELTLKKPPPLVPSCLMATWDAAGPTARICSVTGAPAASFVGAIRVAVSEASHVWTTPSPTRPSARTTESGSST